MLAKIIANKPLAGGKFKVITNIGDFYHTEAINYDVADIAFEVVKKDDKEYLKVLSYSEACLPAISLPRTTVSDTPAPGGEPVVKKIQSVSLNVGDPDRMSKADWAAKDRNIELVAIVKSTIESPAYRELIMGKNTEQACEVFDILVTHFLEKFEELRNR